MSDGMKPGAGSNPLSGDDDGDNDSDDESVTEREETLDVDGEAETTEDTEPTSQRRGVPWLFARDGVKSSREHTYQLHLRSDTRTAEKRFKTEIEERVGEDVYKADLREAALLAAMENPDDVVAQLREWGYDADLVE